MREQDGHVDRRQQGRQSWLENETHRASAVRSGTVVDSSFHHSSVAGSTSAPAANIAGISVSHSPIRSLTI
ncbi:hypothetical protein ACFQV8_07800 [Pseudonocardia benzenivorans]